MTDKIVVLSTSSSREEANRIAEALIDKRLAACVNVVPGVESIYRWRGAIERSQEFLLIIKSRRELLDKLTSELARIHSYEVPEALALQVVDGAESYLGWIDKETGAPTEE